MCQGEPNEENNPFAWVVVVENYPCSMRYDPSLPRVMLLNEEGELAARQACYVDDIHVAARGHEATVAACKKLKSRMNSLGNQADDRKYHKPSTTPNAWRGEIIHTDTPHPMKSTTGKKWVRF